MPDGGSTGIGASVKRKEDYRFLVGLVSIVVRKHSHWTEFCIGN